VIRRYWWPLLVLVVGLPVALLASGVRIPWLAPRPMPAEAEAVPDGDQEMAWIHTTTAGTTWERFVSGMKRGELTVPGLQVDDARAFPDQTTVVPEVVLRMPGRTGSLRIRWYKLTSEATATEWVKALARRDPAPLALIGGGSSDRAADLARALAAQTAWHGDRPLLLITTATADAILEGQDNLSPDQRAWPKLIDVYDDRSFRFCFTNRQMAEAVTDFVLQDATLRPGPAVWPGFRAVPMAAGGPWIALAGLSELWADTHPAVFSLAWKDDPYSVDLSGQFKDALFERFGRSHVRPGESGSRVIPSFFHQGIEFSVGSLSRPNRHEAAAADSILANLPARGQRGLLVIPTVAPSARRVLKTLAEGQPRLGRRLVALTGDGIGVNTIYRDAEFAWPIRTLQISLVMFTHNNPFGWDEPGGPTPPRGYELVPPNSTEDVLHFAELGRHVARAVFPAEPKSYRLRQGLLTRADDLAASLWAANPPFFDKDGNRRGGSGEYVVVLRPNFDPVTPGRPRPDGTIDVYRRAANRAGWERTRPSLPVFQEPRADGRHPE
jgi:hypothetical protein